MARDSDFVEYARAAVAIFVIILLFGIFYFTPSPIQSSFKYFVNQILIGLALLAAVIIVVLVVLKILNVI